MSAIVRASNGVKGRRAEKGATDGGVTGDFYQAGAEGKGDATLASRAL